MIIDEIGPALSQRRCSSRSPARMLSIASAQASHSPPPFRIAPTWVATKSRNSSWPPKTDPDGLPSGCLAADLAFPLDFTLERLAEQVWFLLDVVFGHLPENTMSVEVKDIDRRLGLVVESCDERIERGWPEQFPSRPTILSIQKS